MAQRVLGILTENSQSSDTRQERVDSSFPRNLPDLSGAYLIHLSMTLTIGMLEKWKTFSDHQQDSTRQPSLPQNRAK